MNTAELLLRVLEDGLWSGIAAFGFALLFNVPRRALWACVLMGALGHMLRTLLLTQQFSIEASTLVAATVLGFLAKSFAARLRMPSMIFAICGSIPMVPGVYAYETMLGVLHLASAAPGAELEAILHIASNGVKAGLILIAISAGIAAPTLLIHRHKPII